MKIYTKKGDTGETALYGGSRVSKDDLRIQAYGTLDELNAVLGMILSQDSVPVFVHDSLLRIQGELFQLGAELATPPGKPIRIRLIQDEQVTQLEHEIDQMESELSPLKTFILPGGSPATSITHLARTVSRRAEREVITLHHSTPLRDMVLQYLNRLSDFLFVTARYLNLKTNCTDIPWIAPE